MYSAADLAQLRQHEAEAGMPADPHVDAFMEAQAMRGKKNSVNTEFLLHLLGLGVRFGHEPMCALSSEVPARILVFHSCPAEHAQEHSCAKALDISA